MEDPKGWNNLFRQHVVASMDEEPFRILFDGTGTGAPNSPIRLLVGMMILKESLSYSDKQLFEQCEYNLLFRSALGLMNLDEPVPAESTYYLLRQRIYENERATGVNLFDFVFKQVTRKQVQEFHVNGKLIRMDSKLIGSNIAWFSRYEVIHETLRKFYEALDESDLRKKMGRNDREDLKTLLSEEGEKVVYRSTKEEVQSRMQTLGLLIYRLLRAVKDNPYREILERVFTGQFKRVDGGVEPRDKADINSNSVQSPHDPDCSYRNKGDQSVKGYSVNITETCSKDQLNLITDVQVERATVPDNGYVQEAITETQEVTEQEVKKVFCDGAYHSVSNQEFSDKNSIDLVITGIQGAVPRYDPEMTPEGLLVRDRHTGEIQIATKSRSKKNERWRINHENGYRYFTPEEIKTADLRRLLLNRPNEELRIRNNVEATIFQLSYPLRNNKTRYRGLFKQRAWAQCRCMWVNLVRIKNLIESTYQRTQNLALQAIQTVFPSNFSIEKYALNRTFGIFSKWAPDQLYVREISF